MDKQGTLRPESGSRRWCLSKKRFGNQRSFRRIGRDDVLSALSRRARKRCKACKMVPGFQPGSGGVGFDAPGPEARVLSRSRNAMEPGRSWVGPRALTAEKRSLRADGATLERSPFRLAGDSVELN